MKGQVEFRLTQDEMNTAIQYYLNEVVLKDSVVVHDVSTEHEGIGYRRFAVKFESCCQEPDSCDKDCPENE